jgi:recombination protein RecT
MQGIQGALARQQNAQIASAEAGQAKRSLVTMMNSLLDSEGYRRRFEDLLGKRTPQFVSSLVSMVNGSEQLKEAFMSAPVTVIQAALKAASYDLPIDPGLGYAYIVPFNNTTKGENGRFGKRREAQFILGYKGMIQLALRTGAYRTINVIDVREGELRSYDRLREEIVLEFIENEDERETKQVVGYVGYYRLINGTEKTIYMTKSQIEAHEKRNRKGDFMGKGWKDDWDAMARKTVLRRLIGKWGLMSIDYQTANAATISAAEAIAKGQFDDEDAAAGDMIDSTAEPVPEIAEPEEAK